MDDFRADIESALIEYFDIRENKLSIQESFDYFSHPFWHQPNIMTPPVLPDNSTPYSPLAPSVEKAYYRKCIELKRRLNEVEVANDEAKIRRVRLDRAVMKMRLERAFLLDELRKRMEYNIDGSEASEGEEGAVTPPPDRPHRDKRRRVEPPTTTTAAAGPTPQQRQPPPEQLRLPSTIPHPPPQPLQPPKPSPPQTAYALPSPAFGLPSQTNTTVPFVIYNGMRLLANAQDGEGNYIYVPPERRSSIQPAPSPAQAPSEQQPQPQPQPQQQINGNGTPNASNSRPDGYSWEKESAAPIAISRAGSSMGEPVTAGGPRVAEDANGDRRIASSSAPSAAAESANADAEQSELGGAFTAVNQ